MAMNLTDMMKRDSENYAPSATLRFGFFVISIIAIIIIS